MIARWIRGESGRVYVEYWYYSRGLQRTWVPPQYYHELWQRVVRGLPV